MKRPFRAFYLVALLTALPVSAQTLFHGAVPKADFQNYLSQYELNFLDFENSAVGAIQQDIQSSLGISFYSTISIIGSAFSIAHNAYISSASVNGDTSHKLVGTPYIGGSDDGRVGYEIRFDTPQSIVGLVRNWTTDAKTSFYNSSGTLLGTHTNTVGIEFVGFISNYNDTDTWVSKVVLDTIGASNARQVGYTDDIMWGTANIAAIPEPATYLQIGLGLGLIGCLTRRRRTR